METTRRGWLAFGLSAAAVAWSLLLIAGQFVIPAYSDATCEGSSPGGSSVCREGTATSFETNGWWVVVLFAAVTLVATLAAVALHLKCRRGERWAEPLAWGVVAVLFVFSLAGAASVGMFALPLVLLLALSAALTPSPPARPAR